MRNLSEVLMEVLPCYQVRLKTRPASCNPLARPVLAGIYIEGHADSREFRCDHDQRSRCQTNWDLSAMRAVETFKTMMDSQTKLRGLRGVDGEKLFGV